MSDANLPETTEAPFVYDYKTAPNREIILPKTVPLPGFRAYLAEQKAADEADAAKWLKQLADYEAAKSKAEAEGKDAPKPPAKAIAKKNDTEMTFPAPVDANDPDLLRLMEILGLKVEEAFEQGGELTCQVAKEHILEALRLCREDASLKFEMLADETATHYPAAKDFAFCVVYHLTSLARKKRLRLRILIPEGFEPESATQVYPSANWMEREIWDMFGIRFANHPDMTRILCPEDWEGHALRKDYPVVGWGQRDIDFREDRSGMLNRIALEKAGQLGINLKRPKAE
jgi:NADH-quinone oxidoreductase subunit C